MNKCFIGRYLTNLFTLSTLLKYIYFMFHVSDSFVLEVHSQCNFNHKFGYKRYLIKDTFELKHIFVQRTSVLINNYVSL